MEFPLSLRDSTRAEDARPVEFPFSLTDSTRAEDARPVEFPLSLTDSTQLRRTRDTRKRLLRTRRRPVEFPLSLTDSTRAEPTPGRARPVEFPLIPRRIRHGRSRRLDAHALWSSPLYPDGFPLA